MLPVVLPQVMEHFQENLKIDLAIGTTLENGALQRN